MFNLFVYGTLKKGYSNYSKYLSEANYLGKYKTCEKYPLVIANERYSPVMIKEPHIGHQVIGEVYTVNHEILQSIDVLESVDKKLGYRRIKIQVASLSENQSISCYAYFKSRNQLKIIHSNYLSEYTDKRYMKKM